LRRLSLEVLVHLRVTNPVLFTERVVLFLIGVSMAGLVMCSGYSSQTRLEGGSPTRLAFVTLVKSEDQYDNPKFLEVRAKT
jgi:hypothetical protein